MENFKHYESRESSIANLFPLSITTLHFNSEGQSCVTYDPTTPQPLTLGYFEENPHRSFFR